MKHAIDPKIQPTYAIWLLGETLRPLIKEAIHRFRLRDEQGRSLLNHGRIWLFELSKFPGQADDEVFGRGYDSAVNPYCAFPPPAR